MPVKYKNIKITIFVPNEEENSNHDLKKITIKKLHSDEISMVKMNERGALKSNTFLDKICKYNGKIKIFDIKYDNAVPLIPKLSVRKRHNGK